MVETPIDIITCNNNWFPQLISMVNYHWNQSQHKKGIDMWRRSSSLKGPSFAATDEPWGQFLWFAHPATLKNTNTKYSCIYFWAKRTFLLWFLQRRVPGDFCRFVALTHSLSGSNTSRGKTFQYQHLNAGDPSDIFIYVRNAICGNWLVFALGFRRTLLTLNILLWWNSRFDQI